MPNNILITGMPGVGKTTLLKRLIGFIDWDDGRCRDVGFVTEERLKDGKRVGFDIVDYTDNRYELATYGKEAEYKVPSASRPGSFYGVSIVNLDEVVEMCDMFPPDATLYLDEIGQMELFSEKFRRLVLQYLDAENTFLGTVSSFFEDPFVVKVKGRDDVRIFEVTPENREAVYQEVADYEERLVFGR